MDDLRWVPGSGGYVDLKDGAGRTFGYVGGTRAYVLGPQVEGRPWFDGITDHPTEEAARAHVEAEVRRIHGGEHD